MIVKEAELDPKHLNLWKKGLLAIEQKNWEYAVSLILPVVKDVPTFMDGRMALRRAEGEMSGTAKKFSFGGGMFNHSLVRYLPRRFEEVLYVIRNVDDVLHRTVACD